jgi:hypothetical protein
MRDKHIPVTAQIVVNEEEFFCPVSACGKFRRALMSRASLEIKARTYYAGGGREMLKIRTYG